MARQGDKVIIAIAGKPVAKLVPLRKKTERCFGVLKGKLRIAKDLSCELLLHMRPRSANLPDHHRDPFDRILIAQAIS